MAEPNNPHDGLFKAAFKDPRAAAAQFRALLPSELLASVDLDRLELRDGSYIDEVLLPSHSDLLFAAPLRGREEALLYVLYEHRSTPHALMPYVVLRYMVRIWSDWLQAHEGPSPPALPPIVPLVLYHGVDPWTGPRSLQEILDVPPAARAAASRCLPALELVIDDLSERSDEELEARRSPPLAALALFLFKHGRRGRDLLAVWRRLREQVATLRSQPDWALGLQQAARYTSCVGDVPAAELARFVAEVAGAEAGEIMKTTADRLREEGEQRMLLRILRVRFGELPEAVLEQVSSASEPVLDVWAERVLSAATLDEVFETEER